MQLARALCRHARLQTCIRRLDFAVGTERLIEGIAHARRHRIAADHYNVAGGQGARPGGGRLCRFAQRRQIFDEGQRFCRRHHVDAAADEKLCFAMARNERQSSFKFRREIGEVSERGVGAAVAINDCAAGVRVVAP